MVKIITRKTISSSASREEHILQKIQQQQRRLEYTTRVYYHEFVAVAPSLPQPVFRSVKSIVKAESSS